MSHEYNHSGPRLEEVKTAFNNACAAAGIEDFTFHDLRRTGATRLAEAGADAFYIQALLGHSDIKTSQVYAQATSRGLRDAVESLMRARGTDTKVPTQEERRPLPAAVNS